MIFKWKQIPCVIVQTYSKFMFCTYLRTGIVATFQVILMGWSARSLWVLNRKLWILRELSKVHVPAIGLQACGLGSHGLRILSFPITITTQHPPPHPTKIIWTVAIFFRRRYILNYQFLPKLGYDKVNVLKQSITIAGHGRYMGQGIHALSIVWQKSLLATPRSKQCA